MQDDFAEGLRQELCRLQHLNKSWSKAILWPVITRSDASASDLHATAVRIYPEGETPENTEHFYDVFEGYWSPIDKNQTTVQAVLQWLLRSLFSPLNGFAKLYASPRKTLFDIGYVLCAFFIIVALLILFAAIADRAWFLYASIVTCGMQSIWDTVRSAGTPCGKIIPGFLAFFTNPVNAVNGLGSRAAIVLLIAAIGSYAFWQLIFSVIMEMQRAWRRRKQKKTGDTRIREGPRTSWRYYMQAALAALSIFCFGVLAWGFPITPGARVYETLAPAFTLVAAVGALKSALALIQGFLINFLGDVQIYCTQDENAKFFELRKSIVQAVESVILSVLRTTDDQRPKATVVHVEEANILDTEPPVVQPYYDKIFVAAHSLGSTIALDALMNIHELVEEQGMSETLWRRLRGLITFGTSLEKTRFFFDVRNPSYSASVQRWRDDVYGHLFTKNKSVLQKANTGHVGIYWANFWYEHDLVANQIVSYRSSVAPGSRLLSTTTPSTHSVCDNVRLGSAFPWRVWVHGDYLGDPQFWRSGLDAAGKQYTGAAQIIA